MPHQLNLQNEMMSPFSVHNLLSFPFIPDENNLLHVSQSDDGYKVLILRLCLLRRENKTIQ